MILAACDLFDQDIEAAVLGDFEVLLLEIAFLHFLMIKTELAIGIVSPHKDLSEFEVLWLLLL